MSVVKAVFGFVFLAVFLPPAMADVHSAAEQGDAESVTRLLEEGTPVDSENASGETALYLAAKRGHVAVVELLLERGADINKTIESSFGSEGTALHVAVNWGHIDVVRLFLDSGADPNLVDRQAGPPLHIAIFRGRRE